MNSSSRILEVSLKRSEKVEFLKKILDPSGFVYCKKQIQAALNYYIFSIDYIKNYFSETLSELRVYSSGSLSIYRETTLAMLKEMQKQFATMAATLTKNVIDKRKEDGSYLETDKLNAPNTAKILVDSTTQKMVPKSDQKIEFNSLLLQEYMINEAGYAFSPITYSELQEKSGANELPKLEEKFIRMSAFMKSYFDLFTKHYHRGKRFVGLNSCKELEVCLKLLHKVRNTLIGKNILSPYSSKPIPCLLGFTQCEILDWLQKMFVHKSIDHVPDELLYQNIMKVLDKNKQKFDLEIRTVFVILMTSSQVKKILDGNLILSWNDIFCYFATCFPKLVNGSLLDSNYKRDTLWFGNVYDDNFLTGIIVLKYLRACEYVFSYLQMASKNHHYDWAYIYPRLKYVLTLIYHEEQDIAENLDPYLHSDFEIVFRKKLFFENFEECIREVETDLCKRKDQIVELISTDFANDPEVCAKMDPYYREKQTLKANFYPLKNNPKDYYK